MKAIICVAFLSSLAVGVLSVVPGVQYKIAREYIMSLALTDENIQDTLDGLDVDGSRDNKISMKDLNLLFWHGEAQFAKKKFLNWLDRNRDGAITKQELTRFMTKEATVLAVIECRYVVSESLREQCFADQVLTYVYLVLGKENIKPFFETIELRNDKDDVIKRNDVEALQMKYKDLEDIDNFLEELGGVGDEGVTLKKFRTYVTQESISDDFMQCRKSVDPFAGTARFEEDCLVKQLIEYTEKDLTELDIAYVYRLIDTDGNGIDEKDFVKLGVDQALAKKMTSLLERSGDNKIDYGEFRTYAKSPTVQLRLERECTETKKTQAEEIECIMATLGSIMKELHSDVWLAVPDLDMLFVFEELDTSNDGLISESELVGWKNDAKKRFIEEIDDDDEDTDVDLEEFNEYVDLPHIRYGIGDCMSVLKDINGARIKCYIAELKDILTKLIPNENIKSLFKFYNKGTDDTVITEKDVKIDFNDPKEVKYFLQELGMGDDTITLFEFTWYVKQQDLSGLFKKKDNCEDETLHEVLIDYVNNYMTQYDIEKTYVELDTNHDMELSVKDRDSPNWPAVVKSIDNADNDRDDTANFNEFWLWLHQQKDGQIRKIILDDCARDNKEQEQEIKCYVNQITKGSLN